MEEADPTIIAIGIGAALVVWMAILLKFRLIKIAIGVMLFAAAIAITKTRAGAAHGAWIVPVAALRAEIFLGAGILILVGLLLHLSSVSVRRTSVQAWMLLILAWYQGFMRIYHDEAFEGFRTIGGAMLTTLPLLLTIPALLRRRFDWYEILRVIMYVDVVMIGAVAIQIAVDPSRLAFGFGERFVGISGNPQHTAEYLALATVLGLWMAMNDPIRHLRWIWGSMAGIDLILLFGSGSRTGIGLLVLGGTAILYRRWGKAVLLLPLAALVAWGMLSFLEAQNIELGYSRVMSLEDTRSESWLFMWDEVKDAPLVGNGLLDVERSENSYLWGFAAFGVGYFALMMVLVGISVAHCWNLQRAGRFLPQWRPLVDLFIGFNVMYFACAVFEGHIVLRATVWSPWMVIIGSLSAVMLQTYRMGQIEHLEMEPAEAEVEPEDQEYLEDEVETDSNLDYDPDAAYGLE